MAIPHKCPICDGQGKVSKPSHIAGDVHIWIDTQATHTCHGCGGSGIVWGADDPITIGYTYKSIKEI